MTGLKQLFSQGSLSDYLAKRGASAHQEVLGLPRDYLLEVNQEDLCSALADKHSVEAPHLRLEDQYLLDPEDAQIDVSQDFRRGISDRSRPAYLLGTRYRVVIPLSGEQDLFNYFPKNSSGLPPFGIVQRTRLHLVYDLLPENRAELGNLVSRDLSLVQHLLADVTREVSQFNQGLKDFIRGLVAERKSKLLADNAQAEKLGIPLKRSQNGPLTYILPDVRRKPAIELPKAQQGTHQAEPELDRAEYDHILDIIESMVHVMERSPAAFSHLKEEDLRWLLLVPLNGHYEGRATGETFNFGGKTDILIREKDRNVFVAECKFWRGKKSLTGAIDQLLSYACWRDTKAAVVLFNRNLKLSSVLAQIPEVVEEHPRYKRHLGWRSESSLQYVFHQPGDENREMLISIMVFDIPGPQ